MTEAYEDVKQEIKRKPGRPKKIITEEDKLKQKKTNCQKTLENYYKKKGKPELYKLRQLNQMEVLDKLQKYDQLMSLIQNQQGISAK